MDVGVVSPFEEAARDLTRLGYHVIPIRPGAKAPGEWIGGEWRGLAQWPRYRDRKPMDMEVSRWARFPDANIGAVMGSPAGDGLFLIAVDVDASDGDTLDALTRALPPSPMEKRGAKGFTRFYRATRAIKTAAYRGFADILTGFDTRQTVCPPSLHPTGMAYRWTAGPVAADSLPEFTEADMARFLEAIEAEGWKPPVEAKPAPVEPIDDDDFFAETKRSALSRLDAWVPGLGLHGCRRARGGYEAVATWRPSSAGRPVELRKRNLSIQPTGISDFGDGPKGYSAIDLVMAALDLSQPDATAWLRGRLGFDDTPIAITLPPRCAPPNFAAEAIDDSAHELPDALTRVPGLLGMLTDFICDTARRPQRALSLGAALAVLGTLAGRKYAGPTLSGTQLYVLAISRSGAGKDHPLEMCARLLLHGNASGLIGASQFMSQQAVYALLERKPCALCPMDEFGSFLQRINAARASSHDMQIGAVLRSAWGSSFKTMVAPEWAGRSAEPIHAPALSIYGSSTPEQFYNGLSGADVENGLLNRFLLISTRRKPKERDPATDMAVPAMLRARMAEIAGTTNALATATAHNGRADGPAVVATWGDGAKRGYEDLSHECDAADEGHPLMARTTEMAVRLATIRAIGLDHERPTIEASDMAWGREVALWSFRRMEADVADYVADTQNQADAQLVLRKIKEAGRLGHSELLLALRHRLKGRDVGDHVAALAEAGQIMVEEGPMPPKGGKKPKWYRPA